MEMEKDQEKMINNLKSKISSTKSMLMEVVPSTWTNSRQLFRISPLKMITKLLKKTKIGFKTPLDKLMQMAQRVLTLKSSVISLVLSMMNILEMEKVQRVQKDHQDQKVDQMDKKDHQDQKVDQIDNKDHQDHKDQKL
jgi:hypothetical protein